MRKRKEPEKTCGECIHEFACGMWNMGTIHYADAGHCVNYTTVRESAGYTLGKIEAKEEMEKNRGAEVEK